MGGQVMREMDDDDFGGHKGPSHGMPDDSELSNGIVGIDLTKKPRQSKAPEPKSQKKS
jgi:hypothetical protein